MYHSSFKQTAFQLRYHWVGNVMNVANHCQADGSFQNKLCHPVDSYPMDSNIWEQATQCPVFVVGRMPVCCVGDQGFEPQTGPTLRVLK